ncbi:MAG: hypothetical protein A2W91_00095 [Bacteroidetes bacterium GWF2_38_335]|nr:MAG: hypothetical protein A2W91_00095 [Bacteroidetes bacterium GWF2_38_335]OFY79721.1 MAG: hypothetical protein A2281_09690 [Bacteroidetes bacterium RIFOXYA12_FULL_38_20]HBS87573.1 hypothetical protein [Bacteroidales bacterium]
MKKIRTYYRNTFAGFLLLLASFLFQSCADTGDSWLPMMQGRPGEVVLVINSALYSGPIGTEFQKILKSPQVGLPQPEPLFDISVLPPGAVTDVIKQQRNLILVNVGSEVKKTEIVIKNDVWAKKQLVITVSAPNQEKMVALLKESGQKIVDIINSTERKRIIDSYKSLQDNSIDKRLRKKHNISLVIPGGFNYYHDTTNFAWITRTDPHDIRQVILVYYYDYAGPDAFKLDSLIKMRDEILQKYLLGPRDGSYMSTEKREPCYLKEFNMDGKYTAELRGRWMLVNDFMGGPFMSLSRVDEKRNRVVTVEAHVYAPQFDKREYLRQIEAIVYSMKIVE